MNRAQLRQRRANWLKVKLAWAIGTANACARAFKRGKTQRAVRLAKKHSESRHLDRALRISGELRAMGEIDG